MNYEHGKLSDINKIDIIVLHSSTITWLYYNEATLIEFT